MVIALFAGIGGCGVLALAVAWRLNTAFRPFDEAFSDFSEAHQLTDAQLLHRLYAEDGGCSEFGAPFHSNPNTREA